MNYYEILEVSPNASEEIIKTVYRSLVKKYHPDTYGGDKQEAEIIIRKLNAAYAILSNPIKREEYDRQMGLNKYNKTKSPNDENLTNNNFDNTMQQAVSKNKGCSGYLFAFLKTSIIASVLLILIILVGLFIGEHRMPSDISKNDINTIEQSKKELTDLESEEKKLEDEINKLENEEKKLLANKDKSNKQTTNETKTNETKDIQNKMNSLLVTDPEFIKLYLEKNNIKLNEYPDKDKAIKKLEELNSDENQKYSYIESESKLFKEPYYKITINKTDLSYVGDTKNNLPNGFGSLIETKENSDYDFVIRYIGYFKDGRFDGYGKLFNIPTESEINGLIQLYGENYKKYINDRLNYVIYDGEFKDGKYCGKGNLFGFPTVEEEYASKYITESDTVKEIEKLKATMNEDELKKSKDFQELNELVSLPNKMKEITILVCDFEKDEAINKGKLYKDGYLLYDGNFKNSLFDGEGKLYYPSSKNIKYKGEFSSKKYNGKGILYYENGKITYSGEWKMGEYNGKGTLYDENGEIIYSGEWKNGDYK